MTWPIIPPSLQGKRTQADFGYTTPVSHRKRLTGFDSLNGAVTSRTLATSDCGVFTSEPKTSARPYTARADSLAARTGEPQGSPVLHRSVNPVRAASHLTVGSAALHSETGARAMSHNLVTVDFHGQSLVAVLIDGKPYVAIKPICENIGLQWEAQQKRIQRTPVLKSTMSITDMVAQDGKLREMVCIPLSKLNGWLFGVDVNRVREEIKPRLIQYQEECFDVLFRHFMPQPAASAPANSFTVQPSDQLSEAQQIALRALLEINVKKLPHSRQAGAMVKGWSKLKAHFGVSYRDIPAERFVEAMSIMARHVASFEQAEPVELKPDAALARRAFALSAEISRQVQQSVFEAVLAGDESGDCLRWLFSLELDRGPKSHTVNWLAPIERDAVVMSLPQLSRAIGSGDLIPSADDLLALMSACTSQISRRMQAGLPR